LSFRTYLAATTRHTWLGVLGFDSGARPNRDRARKKTERVRARKRERRQGRERKRKKRKKEQKAQRETVKPSPMKYGKKKKLLHYATERNNGEFLGNFGLTQTKRKSERRT